MRIFLAGIMQGARQDPGIHSQDYRLRIAEALRSHLPNAEITDPWTLHPNSVTYNDEQARQTFKSMTALAGQSDVLIAYLPDASMGTAIEMWTAHHARAYVVAVTPLVHNWVVRTTANEVLPDLDSLLAYIESGRLAQRLGMSNE
ncbi:MAG: hypothetical protein AB1791_15155 [Chloroflexota bacterium]